MQLLLKLIRRSVSILIPINTSSHKSNTRVITHTWPRVMVFTYSTIIKRYSGEFLFSSISCRGVCASISENKLAQLISHTHTPWHNVRILLKLAISNTVSSVILDLNLFAVWNRFDVPHILVVGRGRAGRDSVLRSPYPINVAAILSKASIKPTHVEPKAGRIIASGEGAVKRNRKGERRICTVLCCCGKH